MKDMFLVNYTKTLVKMWTCSCFDQEKKGDIVIIDQRNLDLQ